MFPQFRPTMTSPACQHILLITEKKQVKKGFKILKVSKYKFSLGDMLFEISIERSLDFKLDFGMSSYSLEQLSSLQGQSFKTKNKQFTQY